MWGIQKVQLKSHDLTCQQVSSWINESHILHCNIIICLDSASLLLSNLLDPSRSTLGAKGEQTTCSWCLYMKIWMYYVPRYADGAITDYLIKVTWSELPAGWQGCDECQKHFESVGPGGRKSIEKQERYIATIRHNVPLSFRKHWIKHELGPWHGCNEHWKHFKLGPSWNKSMNKWMRYIAIIKHTLHQGHQVTSTTCNSNPPTHNPSKPFRQWISGRAGWWNKGCLCRDTRRYKSRGWCHWCGRGWWSFCRFVKFEVACWEYCHLNAIHTAKKNPG